jgi:predicted transcriptional regulator
MKDKLLSVLDAGPKTVKQIREELPRLNYKHMAEIVKDKDAAIKGSLMTSKRWAVLVTLENNGPMSFAELKQVTKNLQQRTMDGLLADAKVSLDEQGKYVKA